MRKNSVLLPLLVTALTLAVARPALAQQQNELLTRRHALSVSGGLAVVDGFAGTYAEFRDEDIGGKATGFKVIATLRNIETSEYGDKLRHFTATAGIGYELAYLDGRLRVTPLALIGPGRATATFMPRDARLEQMRASYWAGEFGSDVGLRMSPQVEAVGSVRNLVLNIQNPYGAGRIFTRGFLTYQAGLRLYLWRRN